MQKNVASQYAIVYAWNLLTNAPETGDAANISALISKDSAAAVATDDVAPSAITNSLGGYAFLLDQEETNADLIYIEPVSSTAGVVITPLVIYTNSIGTPADIDGGGATIADNLKKLADDNDGGDFDASRDSLNVIRSRGDVAWLTGACSAASKTYTIATITRTVGDNDGGDDGDVDVVDGTYFATGETNAGLRMVVDATFTADDGAENPISLLVWGFYDGGGNHHIDVRAYNYTSSNFEKIGELSNSSVLIAYQFPLSPDHINSSTGAMAVKFAHDPDDFGVAAHVFNIDKIVATTAISSITATNIEAILVDTGTTIPALLTAEAEVILAGTVTTNGVANDFVISAGSTVNDNYNTHLITIYDDSAGTYQTRTILDYTVVGGVKTVTLKNDLTFDTEGTVDTFRIWATTFTDEPVAGGTQTCYTVNDTGASGGTGLQGVFVWVTTDANGNNVVANGTTDSSGEVNFMLDSGGTYYVWKRLSGYTFDDNPETITAT